MTPHIDTLTSPPIIGQFYLVPTVWSAVWSRDLPVLGPRHTDAEIIGFPDHHFHLDTRFLSGVMIRRFERSVGRGRVLAMAIEADNAPLYRRLRCRGESMHYPLYAARWQRVLKEAYAGRALQGPRRLCPHKGVALVDQPVRNGCITCPLHGLIFDAATGRASTPPKETSTC